MTDLCAVHVSVCVQVALAESGCTMAKEREDREGDRERHRQRLNQLHAEMEAFRSAKSEEVDGERRRCEGVRRELEQRLREVEEEGQRVRSEVTAHFEEEARRMQHQYSTQVGGPACSVESSFTAA